MSVSAARRRTAPIAMLLVAMVSTGCAVEIQGRGSAAEPRALPTTAAPSTGPTGPAAPTGSAPPGATPLVIDPVIPGWNVVRSVNRAAAYDVPPDWRVRSEDNIIGFSDSAGNRVASTGAATFGDEACAEFSNLAVSVVRHDAGTDLAGSATILAEAWADLAYLDSAETHPTLTTSAPEPITMLTGESAVLVKTTATLATPAANDCATTTGAAWAVAATGFRGELGPTVILVVVADVDSPGSVPESTIREILCTLRPVQV